VSIRENEKLIASCKYLLVWAGLKQLESKLIDYRKVQEVCNALLARLEIKEKEVLV
jgi:hypothetical protein